MALPRHLATLAHAYIAGILRTISARMRSVCVPEAWAACVIREEQEWTFAKISPDAPRGGGAVARGPVAVESLPRMPKA